MAKYRCKRDWLQTTKLRDGSQPFVELHRAGAEVEYDGLPGDNLEPLDDEAKAKAKEAKDQLEQQRRDDALKSSREGSAILAALVEALQGGGQGQKRFAEQKAPEFNPNEGPAIKMPSPAKTGPAPAGHR